MKGFAAMSRTIRYVPFLRRPNWKTLAVCTPASGAAAGTRGPPKCPLQKEWTECACVWTYTLAGTLFSRKKEQNLGSIRELAPRHVGAVWLT